MKRTLTLICVLVLSATAVGITCAAQDYVSAPVVVSKEKVKKGGNVYYSHVVLEKQTLHSIAQAYGVTVDDIYAANDGLKEAGLKAGSIILIPVSSSAGTTTVTEDNSETAEDAAIGSQSGATDNEGNALSSDTAQIDGNANANDNSNKSTKQNKKVSKKDKSTATADLKDYFIHTAKWYEDVDMVAAKYGVSAEIIMKVNGLTSRKLKSKQQLKIPTNPDEIDLSAFGASSSEEAGGAEGEYADSSSDWQLDGELPDQGEEGDELTGSFSGNSPTFGMNGNGINAVLMLPFGSKSAGTNEISMDFYSGSLLAAKNLAEEGIDLNISVYDASEGIDAEDVPSADFIIGLLSTNAFTTLLESVHSETFVISPLDYRTEELTETNGNFIQNSNSTTAQYEDMARWIGEDMQPGDSVVVIYEKNQAGLEARNEVTEALSHYSYHWSTFSYTILQGRNISQSLIAHFNPDAMNRIVIASDNEAFVNDVIRNLNLLIHSKYDITLYGGSKIRGFENVDVENLHNVNLHSSLSFYTDYDSPRVRDFLMQYRALYNTEPSQTAFQGYDTMYYFASAISRYGENAMSYFQNGKTPMLMSDFEFERAGAGLSRTGVRRVIYEPNYEVTYIK